MSFTISEGLLKLMSIESVMPSNHLILCWPLLLSRRPPPPKPSQLPCGPPDPPTRTPQLPSSSSVTATTRELGRNALWREGQRSTWGDWWLSKTTGKGLSAHIGLAFGEFHSQMSQTCIGDLNYSPLKFPHHSNRDDNSYLATEFQNPI